jgi:hypothetical protein
LLSTAMHSGCSTLRFPLTRLINMTPNARL